METPEVRALRPGADRTRLVTCPALLSAQAGPSAGNATGATINAEKGDERHRFSDLLFGIRAGRNFNLIELR